MTDLMDLLEGNYFGGIVGTVDSFAAVKIDIGAPVVVSTDVFMDIEADGGGDIPYTIGGVVYTLDCTTGAGVDGKARVTLQQPIDDEIPLWQFVYATYSTQDSEPVLHASTEIPNTGGHLSVAYVMIQGYTKAAANKPPLWHRTTDISTYGGRGALSFEREKLRLALHNNRISGCEAILEITTNAGSRDNVDIVATAGTLYQLHKHGMSAQTASVDGVRLISQDVGSTLDNFDFITDFGAITETGNGTTITDGDTIIFDIVAMINSSDQEYLAVIICDDVYTVEADAVRDAKRMLNLRYPKDLDQVCATLATGVLTYAFADNGTWTNPLSPTTTTWQWVKTDIDISTPNYPANYDNNLSEFFGSTYTETGATKARAFFTALHVEAGWDYILVTNAAGVTQREYDGNLGSFLMDPPIDGDTIRFKITSDGSIQYSGAHVDYVEHYKPITTVIGAGGEMIDKR